MADLCHDMKEHSAISVECALPHFCSQWQVQCSPIPRVRHLIFSFQIMDSTESGYTLPVNAICPATQWDGNKVAASYTFFMYMYSLFGPQTFFEQYIKCLCIARWARLAPKSTVRCNRALRRWRTGLCRDFFDFCFIFFLAATPQTLSYIGF